MKKVIILVVIFVLCVPSMGIAQGGGDYYVYLPVVFRRWSNTMRMTRFGDDYDSAYQFTDVLMEDTWKSSRPPRTQQVSGADGAFNFYGKNAAPLSPVTATKKFGITAASAAAIEDELIKLRAATISQGVRKLWWLDRDESTTYWSWAQCVDLSDSDTYKERGRWLKIVTLTFQMDEGVWYGNAMQSWSETMVIPASTVGKAVGGLTNDGNVRALLDVRIVPHDSLTVEDSAVGVLATSQWESASDIADGNQLFVLASIEKNVIVDVADEKDSTIIAAGQSYSVWGDGRFIYSANTTDGIHSYSVDGTGNLTAVDSDDQGNVAYGVWGDGQYVYLANGTGGLHVYSVSAAGVFTHVDSDYQSETYWAVWGDGQFIYVANGPGGLLSYSVDNAGTLTYIDADTQGVNAIGVWGDGKFVYVADDTGGLLSYSVDDSGNLTYIDTDDQGGRYESVWGDGQFIYAACEVDGLRTYSVDADGTLSYIDVDDQGDEAHGVWGDGDMVYLANDAGGILMYSVNAIGELTYIGAYNPGVGTARAVWGDGTYVYLANGTTLRSYAMNTETNAYTNLDIGEGALLDRVDINQVDWLWLPGDKKSQVNVVVDCNGGGAAQEVDVYITWWDTYVF